MRQKRIHAVLSSGQTVHIFFKPYKVNKFTVWNVGLFVGGSRRQANDWNNGKRKCRNRITGNGSISALRYALKQILDFANALPQNAEIQIGWADEKRHKAYRYLLRFSNWAETEDCFSYRSPLYWDRTPIASS